MYILYYLCLHKISNHKNNKEPNHHLADVASSIDNMF